MLKVGDALAPSRVASVENESIVEWSRLLDDPNPIHLDAEAARSSGLGKRTINQGPANLGPVIAMLYTNFPNGRIDVLDISFLGNVFSGDFMEASGTITHVSRMDDAISFSCNVEVRSNGGIALSGSVELTVNVDPGSISGECDNDL